MIKKLLILIVLVAGAAAVGIGYEYQQYRKAVTEPLSIPDAGLTYVLKPGTSIRGLGQDLQAEALIEQPRYLEWLARQTGQAASIRAGEYYLEPGLTMESLLELLTSGRTVQHKFVFIEGTRYRDALAVIQSLENVEQDVDYENFAAQFREWTGEAHPEGWFYPDTYYYSSEDTARDLLQRAYQKMQNELTVAWEQRQPDLPIKTPYEALILASIVEKETAVADERPMIAGVFVNRLRKGMKLQTDPTVIYGMGDRYKGNIRKADLKKPTPYNTYTIDGLPPTPIALSGREALQAVLHPAATDALFFVASGGGRHTFSKTYKQHRKAVIKYQLNGRASRYRGDE